MKLINAFLTRPLIHRYFNLTDSRPRSRLLWIFDTIEGKTLHRLAVSRNGTLVTRRTQQVASSLKWHRRNLRTRGPLIQDSRDPSVCPFRNYTTLADRSQTADLFAQEGACYIQSDRAQGVQLLLTVFSN